MNFETPTLPMRKFRVDLARPVARAIAGLVIIIPAVFAIYRGLYDSFADNPLSGWGMWGTFVIYVFMRPGLKELAVTVSTGAIVRLLYDLCVGERGYPGSALIGMGVFLGIASLGVLAVRSIGRPGPQRSAHRRALGVIALFSYVGVFLGFYISLARIMLASKLDYFLYNFDRSLGFEASFAAGQLLRSLPPLRNVEATVYNSFGFWFALIYAIHANCGRRFRLSILRLFIANAMLGFSLYFLFPAMGPKYAFPTFPIGPGTVKSAAALLSGAPNAMPSLHFGGALLIWWLSRPWKWVHRVIGAFVALTGLATLGLGEHYLIDLIVAVPYAVAILAIRAQFPERRTPMIASSLMLAWLAYLRTGAFHPAASWPLVLVTLGASLALQRSLAARIWAAPQSVQADNMERAPMHAYI